ncbi:hypothetical protein [Olivibacter sitiensis]|uniref:hypothetical protein n=1 Tax=Olivibacter sitiensis TaxID=376470 RepID=UPI00041C8831|nr:hypothetical protein [Olivibacter sitiensis]
MTKNLLSVFSLALLIGQSACNQVPKGVDSNVPDRSNRTLDPVKVEAYDEDSLNVVYYWDNVSRVDRKNEKDSTLIHVDGLVLLELQKEKLPIYIQTSLMQIEVLELPLAVKIDAFKKEPGQSLDLLSGTLLVSKAYQSPFPDVDTLRANELYMINKDIDLSEKEKLDDMELLDWWKKWKGRGK